MYNLADSKKCRLKLGIDIKKLTEHKKFGTRIGKDTEKQAEEEKEEKAGEGGE
jgi:hypothetical protein